MNNYFCVMPFFGAEYDRRGFTTPCCLIEPSADIQEIKDNMLSGVRPPACNKCWKLEDQGLTSDRMIKNSSFDYFKDQDIRFIEQDCRLGKFKPQIIKLYTSNLCNSTCVTCSSSASTAWGALTKNKNLIRIKKEYLAKIDVKDCIMLNFVGGEPLYEPYNFNLLENLIEAGNTNCLISFTTNGSVELSLKQKEILTKFKNIGISISIDGIEDRFEYIRYPLKWELLLKNLRFYKNNNFDVNVSYTISNLNILYYQETIDWFLSQNLNYNHNLVSYPSYFSVNALPESVKKQNPSLLDFFNPHTQQDDENFLKFCNEIKKQDAIKGISVTDYLPELAKSIL
jgi:sulfatase maturation enzyme AslB (radical SAM superfamily)